MKQCRRKEQVVEAWQWRGQSGMDNEPEWVRNALVAWPEVGGISLETYNGDTLLIESPMGRLRVSPGDYLIRGDRNDISIVTFKEFDRLYEPLDAPSALDEAQGLLERIKAEHEDGCVTCEIGNEHVCSRCTKTIFADALEAWKERWGREWLLK